MIGMGDAVVYSFIGTFLLFFLTTVAHIPPAIAGTIAAIGSVWDVFASSLVGYLSDHSRSHSGHHPQLLGDPSSQVCQVHHPRQHFLSHGEYDDLLGPDVFLYV